ncbi:MAG: N-acetylmuramoyl-L-alanine amidase [Bacteroidota bacterium]
MNKNTLRHVLLCVVGFFPVLNGSLLFAQQQDSSEIFVVKNPAASKYVSAITINGMRYVSLPDLVRMFGLNYFYNPVTKKMEIKLSRAEIKLAAENSFVILTDYATRTQTTLQVPVPTHAVGDTLYAPLLYFLPIFNSISRTELAVDTAREMSLAGFDSTGELKHFDVSSVSVESRKNGYLIRIHSSVKIHDADRFIRNDDWLYVTLPNVRADTAALNADTLNPIIEQMLAVQSPTSVQISFKLRKKISTSEIVQDEGSNDLLVSIQTVSPPSKKELAVERKRREEEANQEAEQARKQQDDLQTQLDSQRKKWKLDVIVLDAGHGGNDPGTLGTIGTREKDVTLGIVLKLGKLIEERLPDVKVVYTRKTDRFVELYRRGQIANENQGKLFISIHCNSLEQKPSPTNGFEIYLLRPGKTEDAIKIAQKENAVVRLEQDYQDRYQDITPENFIILTMAQSAYVRQSEQFASLLQKEMGKKLSSASHSVKQAGFYVLVGASMPNVLIETGYLSNRKDEMFLRSPSGQQVIAECILNAIRLYKAAYEKTLKEGS